MQKLVSFVFIVNNVRIALKITANIDYSNTRDAEPISDRRMKSFVHVILIIVSDKADSALRSVNSICLDFLSKVLYFFPQLCRQIYSLKQLLYNISLEAR